MKENKYLEIQDSLLNSLVLFTKLYHKPYTKEALLAGLPIDEEAGDNLLFSIKKGKSLFSRAAAKAGLKTTIVQKPINKILKLQLPMILVLSGGHTCILENFSDDKTKAKIIFSSNEASYEWINIHVLEEEYLGYAFMLKKEFTYDSKNVRTMNLNYKHWFWDTIKLSKSIYIDVIIASLLINIFVLATPLFTMNVYDRVIPNNAKDTLLVFTIGVVCVYLLDLFLKFVRSYFLELAAKKSDVIVSSIILENVLNIKMKEIPKSVGSFASNLKDFDSIRNFLTSSTINILIDIPFAIIFLFVIYYIGGAIVIIPIITIILILLYALIIKKPLQRSIESTHEASAKKNGILIETLQNIETIKSINFSSKIQYNWEESVGEIAKKQLKSKILSSSIPSITGFLIQLNTIFIVFYGVYLIADFELTMGGLIAVVILTSRTIAPLGQTATLLTNYEDAKTAFTILEEIMKKPVDRPAAKEYVNIEKLSGDIEFKNVSFSYEDDDTPALKDVSFTIKEGEKVAIIGKMGSGKSTIAKLLLKIYEPNSGTILIDGIDIAQIDPSLLRANFGYVAQDIHLFRGTLKDNIIGSNHFVEDKRVLEVAKISGVDNFAKTHTKGYSMQIQERGLGLSGGQKQSVAIARSLVKKTPYILMDEPTNAMDENSETQIAAALKEEVKNRTFILITQKLSMLKMVEKIIVIHDGKKIIDETKVDAMKKLGVKNG